MAAAWRRALLAIGLLGSHVAGFRQGSEGLRVAGATGYVPGGVAHTPHVRVPRATSGMPAGRSSWVLPPRRHARPHMAAGFEMPLPSVDLPGLTGHTVIVNRGGKPAAASARPELVPPPRAPLGAQAVIGSWSERALSAEGDGRDAPKLARGAQTLLQQMADDAALGAAEEVFALTAGTEAEDVQAIAAVAAKLEWDVFRETQTRVVRITGLVVSPGADRQRSAGPQLFGKIAEWAAANGCDVVLEPTGDGTREYYEGLGFQLNNWFGRDVVYSALGSPEGAGPQDWRLVTLER